MREEPLAAKTYSVSQLKLYDQCPLRYRYYYIDYVRPASQSIESFVGSRVHESLEYLYQHLKISELLPIAEVVAFYCRRWEQQWHRFVYIAYPQRNREWYRQYGEKCLRRYYVWHYPFWNPDTHIVDIEWPFTFFLDPERNYKMHGHVDRLMWRNDNSYIIYDYKTSPQIPTQRVLARDLQPGVYQLAVNKIFPEARRVMVSWHYVALQKEVRPTLSEHQLELLQLRLVEKIDIIEQDRDYLPKPSPLCRQCEYRENCTAYWEYEARQTNIRHAQRQAIARSKCSDQNIP